MDFPEHRGVGKQSILLINFLYENEGNLKFQGRKVLVDFLENQGLGNQSILLIKFLYENKGNLKFQARRSFRDNLHPSLWIPSRQRTDPKGPGRPGSPCAHVKP